MGASTIYWKAYCLFFPGFVFLKCDYFGELKANIMIQSYLKLCIDYFMLILCCILLEYLQKLCKKKKKSLKNAAGMERLCKDVSQIRKGEVMFTDKTEPDLIYMISLIEDEPLICYFLCWLLNVTIYSIFISKIWS